MKVTKQHFQMVADVIRELDRATWLKIEMAEAFAEKFAESNELFDLRKFAKACGLEGSGFSLTKK